MNRGVTGPHRPCCLSLGQADCTGHYTGEDTTPTEVPSFASLPCSFECKSCALADTVKQSGVAVPQVMIDVKGLESTNIYNIVQRQDQMQHRLLSQQLAAAEGTAGSTASSIHRQCCHETMYCHGLQHISLSVDRLPVEHLGDSCRPHPVYSSGRMLSTSPAVATSELV